MYKIFVLEFEERKIFLKDLEEYCHLPKAEDIFVYVV